MRVVAPRAEAERDDLRLLGVSQLQRLLDFQQDVVRLIVRRLGLLEGCVGQQQADDAGALQPVHKAFFPILAVHQAVLVQDQMTEQH